MLIVIRGGGDLATGVALRLYRSGMDVVICTTAKTDEEAARRAKASRFSWFAMYSTLVLVRWGVRCSTIP